MFVEIEDVTKPGNGTQTDQPPWAEDQLTWLIATVVAVALGFGNVIEVGLKVIAPAVGAAVGGVEFTATER
jgi:hypothetical protein